MLDDLAAIIDILEHHDHRVLAQRADEWTTGFVRAANYDPDRTTPPNRVDDDGYTIPNISDPTGEAATSRPDTIDYRSAVHRSAAQMRVLRTVLHELARSTVATDEEQHSATPDVNKIAAGTCEACARPVTTGPDVADKDRLRHVEGHVLCGTHKRMRDKTGPLGGAGKTIEAFIDSYAWKRGAA